MPTSALKYLVYGLIDPRNGQLRYVGQTSRSTEERLGQHLSEARRGRRRHACHWLRQLLAAGLKPDIEVLETCDSAEALSEAEVFHIAYWRMVGADLTNLTAGGEGTRGWKPSEDWRRCRSEFMKGKRYSLGARHTNETKAKMSAAHVGKTTGEHSAERRLKNSRSQGGRVVVDQYGNRYETQADAARALNMGQAAISAVLRGKRSHHRGYVFRYVE